MRKLGACLLVLVGLIAVVAAWWWALLGMRAEVGIAVTMTCFAVGILGLVALVEATT